MRVDGERGGETSSAAPGPDAALQSALSVRGRTSPFDFDPRRARFSSTRSSDASSLARARSRSRAANAPPRSLSSSKPQDVVEMLALLGDLTEELSKGKDCSERRVEATSATCVAKVKVSLDHVSPSPTHHHPLLFSQTK